MTFPALIELRRAWRVKGLVPGGIHEVGHLEAIDAESVFFAGIGDLEAIETEARALDAQRDRGIDEQSRRSRAWPSA